MSSRTTTLIPEVTTEVLVAVEARVPGAPDRLRRRRRCDSSSEEEEERRGAVWRRAKSPTTEVDVEVDVALLLHHLSYAYGGAGAGVEAAGEEGVRLLSVVEGECRTLISMALSDAEMDRVYTVVGAFTHFASTKLTDKVYMIQERHRVSGYIRLKSVQDGEIGVFEAPDAPTSVRCWWRV